MMPKRKTVLSEPGGVEWPQLDNTSLDFTSLALLKKMFENLPIPMILINKNENIIFLNQAYKDYLHVDDKDFVGKHVYTFISNSRLPIVMKTQKAMLGVHHVFVDGPSRGQEAICHLIPVIDKGEAVASFGIILFQNVEDLLRLTVQSEDLRRELDYYKKELKSFQSTRYSIDTILGKSKAIVMMKNSIYKVSNSKSTVLISGESGSGKELVAHSIHNCSPRGPFPFVRVNCAAIPGSLCESEFFGYVDGAFTGAKRGGAVGKFELANHGTLFLDEVAELPLFMQAKLLRVLQEKEITRVGGSTIIPLDVRVLVATNRDLDEMVQEGTFREDFYYRLNVLNIRVPPLRERPEDIEALLEYYMELLRQEHGIAKRFSAQVLRILKQYSWPGNIRELTNVLEKMYFMTDSDTIGMQDLPANILRSTVVTDNYERLGLDHMVEAMERDAVFSVLESTGHNLSKTAEFLHISRPRLYRILDKAQKNKRKQ